MTPPHSRRAHLAKKSIEARLNSFACVTFAERVPLTKYSMHFGGRGTVSGEFLELSVNERVRLAWNVSGFCRRRVSIGTSFVRFALAATLRAAREVLGQGTFGYLEGLPTVADFNDLIAPR